jgi:hypothetical protein
MSKKSKRLRAVAAKKLRRSRKQTGAAKASSAKKAAAYKALAHNEEWLGSEKERSRRRK